MRLVLGLLRPHQSLKRAMAGCGFYNILDDIAWQVSFLSIRVLGPSRFGEPPEEGSPGFRFSISSEFAFVGSFLGGRWGLRQGVPIDGISCSQFYQPTMPSYLLVLIHFLPYSDGILLHAKPTATVLWHTQEIREFLWGHGFHSDLAWLATPSLFTTSRLLL